MLEPDAFASDAIDVRRLVAHQSIRVATEVGNADIVAPEDEDVRLAAGWSGGGSRGGSLRRRGLLRLGQCLGGQCRGCDQGRRSQQEIAPVDRSRLVRLVLFSGLVTHYCTPRFDNPILLVS